jgi:hypothetical protein
MASHKEKFFVATSLQSRCLQAQDTREAANPRTVQ